MVFLFSFLRPHFARNVGCFLRLLNHWSSWKCWLLWKENTSLKASLKKPIRPKWHLNGETKGNVCCRVERRLLTCYVVILNQHQCFLVLYKKICLKETEVWEKVVSHKIIVTLITQGLPSPFLFVLLHKLTNVKNFLFKYQYVKFWWRYIVYDNSITGYWLCR